MGNVVDFHPRPDDEWPNKGRTHAPKYDRRWHPRATALFTAIASLLLWTVLIWPMVLFILWAIAEYKP